MSLQKRALSGVLLALLLVSLLAGVNTRPIQAQSRQVDAQTIDTFIQGQMKTAGFPGLTVAVIQNGEITLMKGYGTASTGEALTPQSSLYIGSISKSFTALAAMRLWDQGKINLDATVKSYLPDFLLAGEAESQKITVRQLLNQTSGICAEGDEDPNQTAPSLQEQARRMKSMRLSTPPGAKFCYSNQNFSLLGAVLEAASGQSYDDLLQQLVFTPLNMQNSSAGPQNLPNFAKGFGQFFGFPFPREQHSHPGGVPAGYILSSAEDLTHYVTMLMDGGVYQGQRILTPEAHQLLWAPRSEIDSPYAMGWFSWNVAGEKLIEHGGEIESYAAGISMLPDRKTAVIFLGNQNSLIQTLMGYQDFDYKLLSLVSQKDLRTSETQDRLDMGLTQELESTLILAMRILFTLDLLVILLRFIFLEKTSAWVHKKPAFLKLLWAGADIVIPAAVILLILNPRPILGIERVDLIQFLPDLTFWFSLSAIMGLARGIAKVILLLQNKNRIIPAG